MGSVTSTLVTVYVPAGLQLAGTRPSRQKAITRVELAVAERQKDLITP